MLEGIKQWAFTLVITAVVGGLANSLTISDNGGMKKYVKFACAAVAIAVMIMPIAELFKEMPRLFDFSFGMNASAFNNEFESESEFEFEIFDQFDHNIKYKDKDDMERINELIITKTIELLKVRIFDIVYEKTGIKPDDVYIYIKYTGQKDDFSGYTEEIEIEKIIVDMPEYIQSETELETEIKIKEVKLYLKQLFNCETDVSINGVVADNNMGEDNG